MPRFLPVIVGVISLLHTGCGTFLNLIAPPDPPHPCNFGPSCCAPFGGVTRSVFLGGMGVVGGLNGCGELGRGKLIINGPGMIAGGILILAVDSPLSLVGDVVTWPIASARSQGAPWATWWGQQSSKDGRLPWRQIPEVHEPPVEPCTPCTPDTPVGDNALPSP